MPVTRQLCLDTKAGGAVGLSSLAAGGCSCRWSLRHVGAAVIGTGLPAGLPACADVAFDAAFFRLGYGGGFYDRSLESIRKNKPGVIAVGIAYPEQEVASVPTGPHDARLDAVLTPDGLLQPGRSGRKPDAYSFSG